MTFATAEPFATKIRALYQRSKGRDLFDLWLGVTRLGLSGEAIIAAFAPYRPEGFTAALAAENLRAKLETSAFREDLSTLVTNWPEDYHIETATELIIREVLRKL